MKKLLIALFVLSLLALPALAEPEVQVTVIGRQAVDSGGFSQETAILRLDIADGDTPIPSVYALTQSEWLLEDGSLYSFEDVNFDGHDDLVLVTVAGASNATYTFYLWDEDAGAYLWYGGDDLWNYQLYPAQRIVLSTGTSGWAGLLHENKVYAWDESGRQLNLLRSTEWNTLSETVSETDGDYIIITERMDDSVIVETYVDYEKGIDAAETFPAKRYEDPQFMAQRFLFEEEFLGLELSGEDVEDGSNG